MGPPFSRCNTQVAISYEVPTVKVYFSQEDVHQSKVKKCSSHFPSSMETKDRVQAVHPKKIWKMKTHTFEGDKAVKTTVRGSDVINFNNFISM